MFEYGCYDKSSWVPVRRAPSEALRRTPRLRYLLVYGEDKELLEFFAYGP